jgi:branched-chain amino acid transport system permease protein
VYSASSKIRLYELLPWVAAIALYFAAPTYLGLGTEVMFTILFALSLDLIIGYGGIVTLGHSAYFGLGAYTAGILAVRVHGDPLLGLVAAAIVAGLFGLATGAVILRTRALTLLMLTLAITSIVFEVASSAAWLTGGSDGLHSVPVQPVLGLFRFDLFGKTAYLYCLAVLVACWWIVRTVVHSPFGAALVGSRENPARMEAIGAPVYGRRLIAYTISCALAGVAGALLTQTTQFAGLSTLGFERSGDVLVMLVLGGVGRLYGAFLGPAVYIVAKDYLAKETPEYWYLGIGVLLVLIVLFARGGILGILDKFLARVRNKRPV